MCSEIKKVGNQMQPVNIFNDISPWADNTDTEAISRLNRISLFVAISKKIYTDV